MAKDKLSDLNQHLFAQIERLGEEDLKGDELKEEIARAGAITSVAREIISNANTVIKATIAIHEHISINDTSIIKMIGYEGDKK